MSNFVIIKCNHSFILWKNQVYFLPLDSCENDDKLIMNTWQTLAISTASRAIKQTICSRHQSKTLNIQQCYLQKLVRARTQHSKIMEPQKHPLPPKKRKMQYAKSISYICIIIIINENLLASWSAQLQSVQKKRSPCPHALTKLNNPHQKWFIHTHPQKKNENRNTFKGGEKQTKNQREKKIMGRE